MTEQETTKLFERINRKMGNLWMSNQSLIMDALAKALDASIDMGGEVAKLPVKITIPLKLSGGLYSYGDIEIKYIVQYQSVDSVDGEVYDPNAPDQPDLFDPPNVGGEEREENAAEKVAKPPLMLPEGTVIDAEVVEAQGDGPPDCGDKGDEFIFTHGTTLPVVEYDAKEDALGEYKKWRNTPDGNEAANEEKMSMMTLDPGEEHRVLRGYSKDGKVGYYLQSRKNPAEKSADVPKKSSKADKPEQSDPGAHWKFFVLASGHNVQKWDFEERGPVEQGWVPVTNSLTEPRLSAMALGPDDKAEDFLVVKNGEGYCLYHRMEPQAEQPAPSQAPAESCGQLHADGVRACGKAKGHEGNHSYGKAPLKPEKVVDDPELPIEQVIAKNGMTVEEVVYYLRGRGKMGQTKDANHLLQTPVLAQFVRDNLYSIAKAVAEARKQ